MRYQMDEHQGLPVVRLHGALTEGPDAARFCEAVRRACVQGRSRLVLDCAEVTRVTPFGMGSLTTALALARNVGGALALARVPGRLRSLLTITDLQAVFACYPTVEAAVRALRRAPMGRSPGRP